MIARFEPKRPDRWQDVLRLLAKASYHHAAECGDESDLAHHAIMDAAEICFADRWKAWEMREAVREYLVSFESLVGAVLAIAYRKAAE